MEATLDAAINNLGDGVAYTLYEPMINGVSRFP